jgi:hypothetical protein
LDVQITRLSKPWSGSVPFNIRVIDDAMVTHEGDVSDVKLQTVDIVHSLKGQKYPSHKLYSQGTTIHHHHVAPLLLT